MRLISLGEISPTQDGDGALLAITHMSSDNNNNQKDLLKVMQNDTDQYHVGGGGGEIDSRHHELAAGPPFFDDHSNNVSNSLFSSSDTLFNNDEDARTIVSTTTNCSSTSSEMEMESVCIKGKLGDMTAKDANQYMIQCKTCSEWYHGSCIGISCTADNTWECDVCALLNLDELCEQGVIEEPLQKKRKYSESHNARGERLYCVCMGVDDGRFMIQCNACSEW